MSEVTDYWKPELEKAEARLSELGLAAGKLVEFARWVIENSCFDGTAIDGADVQTKAEEIGLVKRVAYDPEVHGENDVGVERGDEWLVFSGPLEPTP